MPQNIQTIIQTFPEQQKILEKIAEAKPIFWNNPHLARTSQALNYSNFSQQDVFDAAARLQRFAPYLAHIFPETRKSAGIIDSPITSIPAMQNKLNSLWHSTSTEKLLLKMDSHLAVSGSIKARGGFYEVLTHAEKLALQEGLITTESNYIDLASPKAKKFFSKYSLAVGSTGNLGLSVGLMGSALGFKTSVHMSSDARQWKKDLLRSRGVTVVEYSSDYGVAVTAGRKAAIQDPTCHFVDDENSRNLFLGYAVAGLRLGKQLTDMNLEITPEQPLFVYLPCGVGGGPGGVTFGLKTALGDNVFCYFIEPTEAPAVTLGLITGKGDAISGSDLGLTGKTAADGLAVSRPSNLVCNEMKHMLAGLCTTTDEALFMFLSLLAETENIHLEPSAVAGFAAYKHCITGDFEKHEEKSKALHLIWATGGSLVPEKEWECYNQQGKNFLAKGLLV